MLLSAISSMDPTPPSARSALAEDDQVWERLHANFDDQEIADLCIMAGTWEAGRRMFQVLQVDTVCDLHSSDGPVQLKVPAALQNVQER